MSENLWVSVAEILCTQFSINYFLSFEIVIMLVTAEELLICGEIETVLKINWDNFNT